jgi:hypothetical protein
VSLSQTERLPSPVAIDGVVVTDIATRSLGVRLSETASGYQRLWWKTAHQQLKAAVENGWANHPFVWASTSSAYQVAHAASCRLFNADGSFSGRHRGLFGIDLPTRPVRDCCDRPQFGSVSVGEIPSPLTVTHSPEVLAAAMAKVSRDAYWWPSPWMYSSLLRASVPSKPPTTPTTDVGARAPTSVVGLPVASEVVARATTLPEVGADRPTLPEVEPVWQALLDVRVWRSRRWWRLAASLVVKRLNR